MDPTATKASFAPMIDGGTRLLIVGSLPGEVSLRRAEYYANPTNQFWRLMEPVVTAPLHCLPYDERLAALERAGVGLWDVIASAHRAGSLDTAIRDSTLNPLGELAARLPSLRACAFNGGKAFQVGRRQLAETPALLLLPLPSSSAAYCAMGFDAKRAVWAKLRDVLAG